MRIRQSQLDAFAPRHAEGRKLVHAHAWADGQRGARVDEATATAYVPYAQDKVEQARFGPYGLLELRTPEGRHYTLDYDEDGRLTQAGLVGLPPYRLSYGADGQLTELRRGDLTMLRLEPIDEGGESLDATFADGAKERLIYEQGLLVAAMDGTGGRLELQRDPLGRVDAVVDALGNAVRYERDDDDALGVTVIHPNGSREVWQSDGDALSVHVDGQPLGRVTGTEGTERAEYADGHAIEITWDADRPVKGVNEETEVAFTYDADGRVTAERQGAIEIAYVYDSEGNLESFVTSDGQQARFSYDTDGLLTFAEDTQGNTFRFEYATDGLLSRLVYPNGVETSAAYQQSDSGAESAIRILAPGLKRPVTLERTRFDVRGRAVRQRLFDTETLLGYDPAGRLTSVTDVAQGNAQRFSWDAAGNRIGVGDSLAAFDASNQIQYQGAERFQHDNLGRMVGRTGGRGDVAYAYNGQGHLIEVHTAIGETVRFAYDAFGRRIRKTTGDRVTHFLWMGQQLLREWTLDGGRQVERREYLFVPGELHPLAVRINGELYCYHLDHSGTPVALTDAGGVLAWRARLDAFGGAVQQEGRVRQPLRHLGQYCDDETGLHYNIFRYYDPSLGRYLTPDPLRFRGGNANFYTYANGDPINQRDPNGHLVFLVALGVVAGAALVGGLIGGAISAAMSQEGERGEAFLKGFGWGALGGAVGAAVPLIGAAAGLGATAIAGTALAADAAVAGIEACVEGSGIGGALKAAGISVGVTLATLGLAKIPGVKRALGRIGRRLSRVGDRLTGRVKQLWYKLLPGQLQAARQTRRHSRAGSGARQRAAAQSRAANRARQRAIARSNMLDEHAESFSEVAKARDEYILVRPVNEDAKKMIAQGAATKNMAIKGKSADWGPQRGAIPVDQRFSKLAHTDPARIPKSQDEVGKLLKGADGQPVHAKAVPLKVDGEDVFIVTNAIPPPDQVIQQGNQFFAATPPGETIPASQVKPISSEPMMVLGDPKSGAPLTADYDLLAVGHKSDKYGDTDFTPGSYHEEKGVFTPAEEQTLNSLQKATEATPDARRVVHHGPEVNNPYPEPFTPPVTVFGPDGGVRSIDTESELLDVFNDANGNGYHMNPNPGWGWKQNPQTGKWVLP